jgi:translation initiation factor IF-2
VDVRFHTVIYEVHDEIKNAMVGLLEPKMSEQYLGRAEIRNTFKIPKVGTIAGSYVVGRQDDSRLPSPASSATTSSSIRAGCPR